VILHPCLVALGLGIKSGKRRARGIFLSFFLCA
jgi:hypothetical protein